MTEREWLYCTSPQRMLGLIAHTAYEAMLEGRRCEWDRKDRLFACACCRRAWEQLPEESRRVIELAEEYADGRAASGVLKAAVNALNERCSQECLALDSDRCWITYHAPCALDMLSGWMAANMATERCDEAACATLLRDAYGPLPFRPVTVEPAWLAWEGSRVKRMAQSIYEQRSFEAMPILADALEDAGCQNAEILGHCRSGGPHIRGCWVVDAVLGKW